MEPRVMVRLAARMLVRESQGIERSQRHEVAGMRLMERDLAAAWAEAAEPENQAAEVTCSSC